MQSRRAGGLHRHEAIPQRWWGQEFKSRFQSCQGCREVVGGSALARVRVAIGRDAFAAETWGVEEWADLDARSGPGTGYAVVTRLPSGTVVEELERTGEWSRVRTSDGRVVFVASRYLVRGGGVGESSDPEQMSAGQWSLLLQHLGDMQPAPL